MCESCEQYDIFCVGTSYARAFCRETGAYIEDGQAPCESYKEKTSSNENTSCFEGQKKNT